MNEREFAAIRYYINLLYGKALINGKELDEDSIDIPFKDQYIETFNTYSRKMVDDFLENFDFHKKLISDLLPLVEEEFFEYDYKENNNLFDKKCFYEIFNDFCLKYHIDNSLININKYYSDSEVTGITVHNPFNNKCDIFINDFKYDLYTLQVLAHEVGHFYDLSHFNNLDSYNKYNYQSIMIEVMSRLFERLFFKFCIDYSIEKEDVKNNYYEFNLLNHSYLTEFMIFTSFDKDILKSDDYLDMDNKDLIKMVYKNNDLLENIELFIDNLINLDLGDTLNYSYGDIISLYLIDNKVLFNNFLNNRDFPLKNINVKSYIKKYKDFNEFIYK